MKTSELTGALLDFWVAQAEGVHAYVRRARATMHNEDGSLHSVLFDEDRCFRKRWNEENKPAAECKGCFWLNYSRDWAQGGQIIEREGIELQVSMFKSETDKSPLQWVARKEVSLDDGDNWRSWWGEADKPLAAAMRAFVASKFGDEVPDDHEAPKPSAEP